jgi:hypothetical protein
MEASNIFHSKQILQGSKIAGESGAILIVDQVVGDVIICGDRRISIAAVEKVISPPPAPLAIGDTCYYCGSKPHHWEQYGGLKLTAVILREGYWTCKKPDGYFTTNISPGELSRLPVDKPTTASNTNKPRKADWMRIDT